MDKINEFLIELEEELKYLKSKDASEVLKHYQDKINLAQDYGDSEAKIIATLPTPKKIAEEVYKSKGIEYLSIRKKQLRRQEITKGIFSGIIVLLILIAVIIINIYLGGSILQLGKLLVASFKMNTIFDIISMMLISIGYIFSILVIMIYVFDLFYILSMHFLYDVLYVFEKKHNQEYKFMDFTISGFIEGIFKNKKIILKTLAIVVISMLGLGIISYATEGFMYRSMNNISFVNDEYEIKENIEEIILEESEVIITVDRSSTVSNIVLKFGNEFNEKLNYQIGNNKLIINKIDYEQYDILGLINEPLSKIEIIIPDTYNLEILKLNVKSGSIDIKEINNITNIEIEASKSNLAFTKNNIDNLIINTFESNLGFSENNINNAKYNLSSGTFNVNKDQVKDLELNNKLASIIINELNGENAKIINSSATSKLSKITYLNFIYEDTSSESVFEDIEIDSISLTSLTNSSIITNRAIIKTRTSLITKNKGAITFRYLKTPKIEGDLLTGTINLYDVNTSEIIKNIDKNEFIDIYNNVDYSNPSLKVKMDTANLDLETIELGSFELETDSSKIDITDSIINRSDINMTETNLIINDLDGNTMYIYVNGGNVSYYNDELKKSNISLTIEGHFIKTTIDVDEDSLKEFKRG